FIMKKIVTATTLTAGIGAAIVGLDHGNEANASEQTTQANQNTTQATSGSSANLYTAGQCTWYVFDKTCGEIGSTWGNANNWSSAASSAGYTVNNSQEAGSILQSSEGSMGNVAYVENVNSDGSVNVSEMNYNGGPYSVSERTISAGEASSYNYIHLN